MVSEINVAKEVFANTLGNPIERASLFRDKLIAANTSIVFTKRVFHCSAVAKPRRTFSFCGGSSIGDGTYVFLRGDEWEPSYQVIAVDDYEGYSRGRLNVILATKKRQVKNFFLLLVMVTPLDRRWTPTNQ